MKTCETKRWGDRYMRDKLWHAFFFARVCAKRRAWRKKGASPSDTLRPLALALVLALAAALALALAAAAAAAAIFGSIVFAMPTAAFGESLRALAPRLSAPRGWPTDISSWAWRPPLLPWHTSRTSHCLLLTQNRNVTSVPLMCRSAAIAGRLASAAPWGRLWRASAAITGRRWRR